VDVIPTRRHAGQRPTRPQGGRFQHPPSCRALPSSLQWVRQSSYKIPLARRTKQAEFRAAQGVALRPKGIIVLRRIVLRPP